MTVRELNATRKWRELNTTHCHYIDLVAQECSSVKPHPVFSSNQFSCGFQPSHTVIPDAFSIELNAVSKRMKYEFWLYLHMALKFAIVLKKL